MKAPDINCLKKFVPALQSQFNIFDARIIGKLAGYKIIFHPIQTFQFIPNQNNDKTSTAASH